MRSPDQSQINHHSSSIKHQASSIKHQNGNFLGHIKLDILTFRVPCSSFFETPGRDENQNRYLEIEH
jgi:hypothetical protein